MDQRGKDDFAKNVWDEFDEFFAFHDQRDSGPSARDDTRGADLKADVEVEFLDAVNGVRKVRLFSDRVEPRNEQARHLSGVPGHQGQDEHAAAQVLRVRRQR